MRLIYFTLAWCAGILLAAQYDRSTPAGWAIAAGAAGLAVLFAWNIPPRRAVHALVFGLTLGGLRFAIQSQAGDISRHVMRGGVTVEGIVTEAPRLRGDSLLVRVEAAHIAYAGQVSDTGGGVLVETAPYRQVQYGDRIRATGDLFRPLRYDTFSYADYLARTGVYSLMPGAAVEIIDRHQGNPLMEGILWLREQARIRISTALPEPQAGLLSGILLGDESSIAPETEDAFARTGASHVIAISGFNMVVVSGIVISILKMLRFSHGRMAAAAIGVVCAYTLFVGASASVVRAALMSSLLIVGELVIRRKTFVPTSLAFAALVLSFFNPTVLWDVGFQLSLFATLGIALFAKPMTHTVSRWLERRLSPKRAQTIIQILEPTVLVSAAAQTLTLPLIALYFERISLVSLLVNLLILPVQPAILVTGAAATMVALFIPLISLPLYWISLVPLAWTTGIVRQIAQYAFVEVSTQPHPRLITALYGTVIGAAMIQAIQPNSLSSAAHFFRRKGVQVLALAASLALLILIALLLLSRPDGRLHIWLLDMGHTNAIFAQTPGGAHLLIDGGRFPSRLLLALGDRMPFNDPGVELVVVTQPDEFDTSALNEVFARYEVGLVIHNGQPNLGEAYRALEESWGETTSLAGRAGHRLDFQDGVRIEILNPTASPTLGDDIDDGALVLRLSYGETRLLFTSDVSIDAQRTMVAAGLISPVTALVLPQHGTVNSLASELLAAADPQIVLLQADSANRRRDPDADTLAKVEGLPLYRTDVSGTLHLVSDGRTLEISQEG
jgi:competence protein ComEC